LAIFRRSQLCEGICFAWVREREFFLFFFLFIYFFFYSDVTELRRLRTQPCGDLVFHIFLLVELLAGQMFLYTQNEMEICQTRQCYHLRSGDFPSPRPTFCILNFWITVNQDSSVSIPTRYRLDGPGIESRCRRDFAHPSRPALGSTQPPIQWAPGVSRTGCSVDHPPPSRAEVKERVELHTYSPSAPSWLF
jgi:hypothetical protein